MPTEDRFEGELSPDEADEHPTNNVPPTYEEWRHTQSQRIYQFRVQTGLTQKEFATLVGWSASQQSQLEQNVKNTKIRPKHVMTAWFVAQHPLEALKVAHELPENVREKVKAYAERIRDLGRP